MDQIFHNPIAEMYGPQFLLFYAVVILITCAACWMTLRRLDRTNRLPVLAVPSDPDPYEIAYLRGGENELIRSVIFGLILKGFLRVNQSKKEPLIERTERSPEQRQLLPLERRVLDEFTSPKKPSAIFRSSVLYEVEGPAAAYEQRLRREHLLMPAEVRQAATQIWLAGMAVVAGLGGYKLFIALSKGRHNVAFLIAMGVVSLIVLALICRAPRLSRRGRAYIERLQLAFEKLKSQAKMNRTTDLSTSGTGVDQTPLLLMGLFGVGALAGTAYDYYPQTFRRATTTSGVSCGSYDASSGNSGCSGCGGGCGGCGCGG